MSTLALIAIVAWVVGGIAAGVAWGREIYRNGIEDRWNKPHVLHKGNVRYAVAQGILAFVIWPVVLTGFCIFAPIYSLAQWVKAGDQN